MPKPDVTLRKSIPRRLVGDCDDSRKIVIGSGNFLDNHTPIWRIKLDNLNFNSDMVCIAEVAIAIKIAELAKRCGLKPTNVDGDFEFIDEDKDPDGIGYHQISFISSTPKTSEGAEKVGKFFGLLGMKDTYILKGPELEDIEDTVERALSHAPRARTIG